MRSHAPGSTRRLLRTVAVGRQKAALRCSPYCGAVVAAIAIFVISLGAILAGRGYVRTAQRMRSFATTRGRVTSREVVTIAGLNREGRWGQGGKYRPKVTYDYIVDGVAYTSDRTSYAHRGLRRSLAEQQLAAIPDEVDVYYDPAAPDQAYLEKHTPTLGRYLLAGGGIGVLFALILLLTSV
jgi:Protein of unknown function (DUF3592)